ncbi:hypothetical protein CRG98_042965 [Punica granatum]|uniref:Uncharacterized protein n=1 Tax=Punica granatum TaxID=22663 RepID=A0A2I0HY63_PUNGR|nr:hypothetical protein CRG98_042965 [Punica granatum]
MTVQSALQLLKNYQAVVAGIGDHHRSRSSFLSHREGRELARSRAVVAPVSTTTAQMRLLATSDIAGYFVSNGGGRD